MNRWIVAACVAALLAVAYLESEPADNVITFVALPPPTC
jgi:hypothetical protein